MIKHSGHNVGEERTYLASASGSQLIIEGNWDRNSSRKLKAASSLTRDLAHSQGSAAEAIEDAACCSLASASSDDFLTKPRPT